MLESLTPQAPGRCVCYEPGAHMDCVCLASERALRAWMQHEADMPPMTPAQKEDCLQEIAMVEGWDRKDYEAEDDAGIARAVLNAWTDYCRDKGLL